MKDNDARLVEIPVEEVNGTIGYIECGEDDDGNLRIFLSSYLDSIGLEDGLEVIYNEEDGETTRASTLSSECLAMVDNELSVISADITIAELMEDNHYSITVEMDISSEEGVVKELYFTDEFFGEELDAERRVKIYETDGAENDSEYIELRRVTYYHKQAIVVSLLHETNKEGFHGTVFIRTLLYLVMNEDRQQEEAEIPLILLSEEDRLYSNIEHMLTLPTGIPSAYGILATYCIYSPKSRLYHKKCSVCNNQDVEVRQWYLNNQGYRIVFSMCMFCGALEISLHGHNNVTNKEEAMSLDWTLPTSSTSFSGKKIYASTYKNGEQVILQLLYSPDIAAIASNFCGVKFSSLNIKPIKFIASDKVLENIKGASDMGRKRKKKKNKNKNKKNNKPLVIQCPYCEGDSERNGEATAKCKSCEKIFHRADMSEIRKQIKEKV